MAWKVFLFLAAFRVANVFLIQSQFDPDEYWQNLEPSYCYVFGDDPDFSEGSSCPGLTWEWKRRRKSHGMVSSDDDSWSSLVINFILFGLEGPVRSFASILPTLIYYLMIKKFRWDSSWMVSRGPLIINAVFVAAATDWTVWYASKRLRSAVQEHSKESKNEETGYGIVFWCIFCQLSSWFNAYTLTRTYSNSLETLLLSLSLALVSQEFLSPLEEPRTSISSVLRAWLAFFLGGVCVSIRFTCLTAYIPMGIILACQTKSVIRYLFLICGLAGFLGFLSTVLLDRVMFGVWAIPVLGNFHFNVIQGNGSLYGTHPLYWYFVAGVPALAGILSPVLIIDLLLGAWDRPKRKLWIVVACYVIAHSWSEHKEFRFLLPILPMICLICGARLQNLTTNVELFRKKHVVLAFAVPNLLAILYLGLFHQRAPIEVNRAILKSVSSMTNPTNEPIQVHYLMGCHSTPLLSHLHAPPAKFEPWYLDCSPECRKSPDVECESDRFYKDPNTFLEQTYYCNDEDENDDQTCPNNESGTSNLRDIPDYIVCNANEFPKMELRLASMNMKEIGRFVNGIDGIHFSNDIATLGDDASDSAFSASSFRDYVSLSYEEVVLLQRV